MTLQTRYDPKANGLGLLRLVLALAVLVAHSWPLGSGAANPGLGLTHGQTDLGTLAVDGFFVLSGFLVAASGRRLGPLRFAWHRFLRIFPGLWTCLLVLAFVLAPLVSLATRGRLGDPGASLAYAWGNWFGNPHVWGIGDLFAETPYGRLTDASVFNGSLWSLVYELSCYAGMIALIATGVLRRCPWLVPLLALAAYVVIVSDFLRTVGTHGLATRPVQRGAIGPIPLIGALNLQMTIYLGFLFLLGATIQLYRHRVPVHPMLALVAFSAFAGSMLVGGFFVVGLPAFAYLLVWAASVLPQAVHGIGRRHDYSYGIYIYAFPVQQVIALAGGAAWGVLPYIVLSASGALVLATLSWHLVERPALLLKDWAPRSVRTPVGAAPN
ncbi:acyltransferase [Dactylosporangium sp. AC04546]|uniref:acyltransferase family protein n=1 Tax=Dactylosporangium sp. AC04546 TaxID=2862460 RepID=UPI001EDD8EA9|nr:acyltransferase [Dactylosporangium sp. AC04546]WVK85375.1 acyltransferase [Dactylosporangium sp. AC04546]